MRTHIKQHLQAIGLKPSQVQDDNRRFLALRPLCSQNSWRRMKTKTDEFLSLAFSLAALVLPFSPIHQAKGDSFVSVSRMNRARNFHTATLLPNGKVLVAGGFPTGTSAELYDPETDTWTVTGSLREARTFHTATLLPNGKVLVAGGGQSGGGGERSRSTELYDPATGKWTLAGPMKHARSWPAVTLLPNGNVLVVGGTGDEDWGSSELYDPDAGIWKTGIWSATSSASCGHRTVTLLPDGKVLGLGCYELYDPATETWTPTGQPSRLGYLTATLLLNGKVLVAGGVRISTAELYDPESGTWSPTGSLIWDRDFCKATLLRNGQVLVTGGFQQGPDRGISSAELYHPDTGTWTEIPMNGVRFSHSATLLPDGRVLVAGGNDASLRALSTAELYEPDHAGPPPSLSIVRNADRTASLLWTGAGALEQTDDLESADWQPAPSQENPQQVPTQDPKRFYRLRFDP